MRELSGQSGKRSLMLTDSNDLPSTAQSQTSESLNGMEKRLSVTLLFSKVTGQVLCIETGKEFVDLLLGFFTLPLGCIIKLLAEGSLLEPQEDDKLGLSTPAPSITSSHSKDGRVHQRVKRVEETPPLTSVANLYESVAKMEDTFLCVDKTTLLDPRPVAAFGGKLLPVSPLTGKKDKRIDYYCCGIACNFVCPKYGAKCPRHRRKMETLCQKVDEDFNQPDGQSNCHTGYAKEGQFIITNTLEIYPSSAIKSLMHLNMLKSERVSDLDNMEILVSADEAAYRSWSVIWWGSSRFCLSTGGPQACKATLPETGVLECTSNVISSLGNRVAKLLMSISKDNGAKQRMAKQGCIWCKFLEKFIKFLSFLVLQLMKLSLCTGNVLDRVFGKHCPKPPPTPFYNYRPHDSGRCRLCPAPSIKGT